MVSIASRLGHWGLDGDYYNATWSLLKDVGFAFLDVSSKAGLAIFSCSRPLGSQETAKMRSWRRENLR